MASRSYFAERVCKLYADNMNIAEQLLKYFDRFTESVELFRHGGFATVDEFSQLASGSYPKHVQNMKKLMRIVLSLHNPEDNFHKSDYYPFVQRLFRSDSLNQFRNDISIITFNYDCYLDFVMQEAYRYRLSLSKIPNDIKDNPQLPKGPQEVLEEPWCSKLSSGFFRPEGEKQLAWELGQFNYFKLHGSISYGEDPISGYKPLFVEAAVKRYGCLNDNFFQKQVPPVVFPWELFSGSGELAHESEHFQLMWKNARQVVGQANKISFVGLSMHEYLEQGLEKLFDDTGVLYPNGEKEVQVVVANTANKGFEDSSTRLHPASPCGRVAELLRKYASNIKYIRSSSEDDGMFRGEPTDKNDFDITPRYSFEEFIEREMD